MSKLNPSKKSSGSSKVMRTTRVAGGAGALAAKQDNLSLLRRAVLANLLWEDVAYMDGESVTKTIETLVPKCKPEEVAQLVIEARSVQKLRHIPLFLIVQMLKYPEHKNYVADLIPTVVTRPDMITDMLALYFKLNPPSKGKKHAPLASALKKGLAACFNKFNEYQFAKYDRNSTIKLRDVMFLTRPTPQQGKEELFRKIANRDLAIPDTWEVALSSGADKKDTWERLIKDGKLGALAFLRNLRNMQTAGVSSRAIREGFKTIQSQMLLPMNFIQAAKNAPDFTSDLNVMMLNTYKDLPKLPGYTIFVVDISGSMNSAVSSKSTLSRLDVACAMAILAQELCEEVEIYATAGSDHLRTHGTQLIEYPKRGFELGKQIVGLGDRIGGGGIFTRQCLEWIKVRTSQVPDRIIIFSDSQDMDFNNSVPNPFGDKNYIVDVSAHTHGINYKGAFTAEIAGFSEHFLTYIAAYEGIENEFEEVE